MGERTKQPAVQSTAQVDAQHPPEAHRGEAVQKAGMRQVAIEASHDPATMAHKLMAALGSEEVRPDEYVDGIVSTARGGIMPADPAKMNEMPKPDEVRKALEKIKAALGFMPTQSDLVALDHYLTAHADVRDAIVDKRQSGARAATWEGTRALVYNALKALIMSTPDELQTMIGYEIDHHHLLSGVSIYDQASFINSTTSHPSFKSLAAEFAGIRDGLADAKTFDAHKAEVEGAAHLRGERSFLSGYITLTEQLLPKIAPAARPELEKALEAAKKVFATEGADAKTVTTTYQHLDAELSKALANGK